MTIRQLTRKSFAAILFVVLIAASPSLAADARAIVEKCAEGQTTTKEAAALTKPDAVKNLFLDLDVTEVNVGRHSGAGRLRRWYLRGESREKDLVRSSWRDASNKTTETGRARRGAGALGWVRTETTADPWLMDPAKHKKDLDQIQRDVDEMREIVDFFLIRKLLGPEAKFEHLGVEKGGGRAAHKIRRTSPTSRPMIFWIDTKTSVLHGVQIEAAREGETQLNYCFSGLKTFDGIRAPKEVKVYERPFEQPDAEGKLLFHGWVDAVRFNDAKLGPKAFEPKG